MLTSPVKMPIVLSVYGHGCLKFKNRLAFTCQTYSFKCGSPGEREMWVGDVKMHKANLSANSGGGGGKSPALSLPPSRPPPPTRAPAGAQPPAPHQ